MKKVLLGILLALAMLVGTSAGAIGQVLEVAPSEINLGGTCTDGGSWDVAINDGGYGGLAETDFCLVRGPTDCSMSPPVVATVVLNFPAGTSNIVVRHLDGISDLDNFDVMLGTTVVGSYNDANDDVEEWETDSFSVSTTAGSHTVTIVSTDAAWSDCSSWGQLAIDWIKVEQTQVPEFTYVGSLLGLVLVAGIFVLLRKR